MYPSVGLAQTFPNPQTLHSESCPPSEGLYAFSEFLASHPDFRCACKWGVNVFSIDPIRLAHARVTYHPGGESEWDEPAARFERFFNGGLFLPYLAVHRRSECMEDLAPVPDGPDINFIEILNNGLSVIRGKIKRLDRFFSFARGRAPAKTASGPRSSGWPTPGGGPRRFVLKTPLSGLSSTRVWPRTRPGR